MKCHPHKLAHNQVCGLQNVIWCFRGNYDGTEQFSRNHNSCINAIEISIHNE